MIVAIITFIILILCIAIMSIGIFLNNKPMSGSCGNSKENPCSCSIIDKIKCQQKLNLQ